MKHFTFTTVDTGFDIYKPASVQCGYAYSPSIIDHGDGRLDAWFSCKGDYPQGVWDWIGYRHSEDGGNVWTEMRTALQPTPDSLDQYSCCDPGVIYLDGYYYLGYTSTVNCYQQGRANHIFVARSRNPEGPYEKWNGNGWGGDPAPFIVYDGEIANYGAGEVSFVEAHGTLYIYYTWSCKNGEFMMTSMADAKDPNWPATVYGQEIACQKLFDQADIVYVEEYQRFLGFGTLQRFSDHSGIQLLESEDGIHFTCGEFISDKIAKFCHNMGVSKGERGHVSINKPMYIGYGYSAGDKKIWGQWATRLQKIELSVYEGEVRKEDQGDRGIFHYDFWLRDDPDVSRLLTIRTSPASVHVTAGSGPVHAFDILRYDLLVRRHVFDVKPEDLAEIHFTGYDENIVKFLGTDLVPQAPGQTVATLEYRGHSFQFKIYVYPEGTDLASSLHEVEEIFAMWKELTLPITGWKKQLHAVVRKKNGAIDFAGMGLPKMPYTLTFSSSDENVLKITEDGTLIGVKPGTAVATMELSGKICRVKVEVVDA